MIRIKYKCNNCGYKYYEANNIGFFIKKDTLELIEYELLGLPDSAYIGFKLHGELTKTYCEHCDKPLNIYSIRLEDDNISKDEAVSILVDSIENNEKYFFENIDKRYFIEEDKNYFYLKEANNLFTQDFNKKDYDSVDEAKQDINKVIEYLIKRDTKKLFNNLNSEYLIEFSDVDDNFKSDTKNLFDTIFNSRYLNESSDADDYFKSDDNLMKCPKCSNSVSRTNFKSRCPKCEGNSSILDFIRFD